MAEYLELGQSKPPGLGVTRLDGVNVIQKVSTGLEQLATLIYRRKPISERAQRA